MDEPDLPIGKKEVSKYTKKITYTKPILTYLTESWTLTKKHKSHGNAVLKKN